MQFGFMKSKETIDTIFVVSQMQEKFRVKDKKLNIYIKLNSHNR